MQLKAKTIVFVYIPKYILDEWGSEARWDPFDCFIFNRNLKIINVGDNFIFQLQHCGEKVLKYLLFF